MNNVKGEAYPVHAVKANRGNRIYVHSFFSLTPEE